MCHVARLLSVLSGCKLCQHVLGRSDVSLVVCGLFFGCLGCFGQPWVVLGCFGLFGVTFGRAYIVYAVSTSYELFRLFSFVFGDARLCEAALIQVVLVLSVVSLVLGCFYSIQLFDVDVDDDDDDDCAIGSVYRPASK